jgi:hypothetical protein
MQSETALRKSIFSLIASVIVITIALVSCTLPYLGVPSYTVTYNANGGQGAPVDTGQYRSGAKVAVLSPGSMSFAGHSFAYWTTVKNDAGSAVGSVITMGKADITLYALWDVDPAAQRAQGIAPAGEIGFNVVDGGTDFHPLIVLASGSAATVLWRFTGYGGGTVTTAPTSTDAAPSVAYTGTMLATLVVTPWSALEAIDLGYDGNDSGKLYPPDSFKIPPQNVIQVQNLSLAKDSLITWCSSNNTGLTSLDFSGFSKLADLENFIGYSSAKSGLVSINLSGTTSLSRLCLENNNLASLDLSDCVKLSDLRGALNEYTQITFPAVPQGSSLLWHLCVRDNAQYDVQLPDFGTAFPKIEELFIWNTNQKGVFVLPNQYLSSVQAFGNSYQSADLSGALFPYGGNLDLSNNHLVSIKLDGAGGVGDIKLAQNDLTSLDLSSMATMTVRQLDLSNNNLNDPNAVAKVLADLAASGATSDPPGNFYVHLEGVNNAKLNAAAQISKAELLALNWVVTDNGDLP